MADNTLLNAGSGGDLIRDVLKGSVKTPVCILDVGGSGAESLLAAGQATMAASLPVAIASNQSAVPVSGTFFQATQPVSLASLPALPAGTATIGSVSLAPATTGGLSAGRVISAASTNATSVKASAGLLYGYAAVNTNAAFRHLKIYDKATAPTVGTDTPLLTIPLPPSGGANLAIPAGVTFSLGIALAITGGMADSDTGAVGAADVAVQLFYK